MIFYLASPYSHADPAVREERFDAACRAAAALMQRGHFVFSPVAHGHPICKYGLPLEWEFWEPFDRRHLEMCDEMIVLTLPGWRESTGVQAEIRIARELEKAIGYVDPTTLPTLARVAAGTEVGP